MPRGESLACATHAFCTIDPFCRRLDRLAGPRASMPLTDVLKLQYHSALQSIVAVAWLLLPMMALEFVKPSHRHQWRTLLFNLAYAPAFLFLSGVSLWYLGVLLEGRFPGNWLGLSFGEAPAWHWALLIFAYLVVFDFCYYWLHRAQHRWPLLWRFHRFRPCRVKSRSSSLARSMNACCQRRRRGSLKSSVKACTDSDTMPA